MGYGLFGEGLRAGLGLSPLESTWPLLLHGFMGGGKDPPSPVPLANGCQLELSRPRGGAVIASPSLEGHGFLPDAAPVFCFPGVHLRAFSPLAAGDLSGGPAPSPHDPRRAH